MPRVRPITPGQYHRSKCGRRFEACAAQIAADVISIPGHGSRISISGPPDLHEDWEQTPESVKRLVYSIVQQVHQFKRALDDLEGKLEEFQNANRFVC